MRSIEAITTAMLLAATASGGLAAAPTAVATKDEVPVNGTYRATSIGNWAKTNLQYHNEPTIVSTWTISSSCVTYEECTGTVSSDQGWSAPMVTHDGSLWYVRHDVPDWERCPDGTAFTGHQTFYFYYVDFQGYPTHGSPTLAGKDKTLGPSGACGQNTPLAVELPFRLDRIG